MIEPNWDSVSRAYCHPKTWCRHCTTQNAGEKEAMPLLSGAFSMARERSRIIGGLVCQTRTRSKSESDSRG